MHPQHWPEDLDLAGQRVVLIGSGATAATILPAIAGTAAHVTMLQRSPSYVLSMPNADPVADLLRKVLPERRAYAAVRWKNARLSTAIYGFCRRYPARARAMLQNGAAKRLPDGYDIATHFTPAYEPWDQRMCLVPDGDFFAAIKSGQRRRGDRSHRGIHPGRDPAALRRAARGRRDHHGDRAEPEPRSAGSR